MIRKKTGTKSSGMIRIILIALVVILVWRGVDGLLNTFLFPDNEILSDISSILIALVIIYFAKIRLKELD